MAHFLGAEEELAIRVRRFFEILDIKEESVAGNLFAPVYISSCRVLLTQELGKLLTEMKELSEYKNKQIDPGHIRTS